MARPLVLGEDPGLTSHLSNASGLVLSMLWFGAAIGWAVWLAWSRQGAVRGSLVEAGLALFVGLVFLGATAGAHYKHPAMLIAWEWVVFLLAFLLVRQMARTPEDSHSLLAAILATAVSLSAHAVYQYAVEMPDYRESLEDPDKLRRELAKLNIHLEPNDPQLAMYQKRVRENNVFATYAHPNSFAGFLALFFPAAGGWALVARRQDGWNWRTLSAASIVLLMGVALWLTHSRGALLALLVVGAVSLAVYGRRSWWPYRVWVVAGLAGVTAASLLISHTASGKDGLEKARRSFGQRTEYWTATSRMIADSPLLGVGPGNFGRHYPRYMAETALERIQDPHNFALEIWATSGVFALLTFLMTLAVFFWQTWSALINPSPAAPTRKPSTASFGARVRWEFYLGGMAGLILGFMLRAADRSADEIVIEAVLSGGRSLIWFTAIALLDNIPWCGPSRSLALTTGVTALLLNLTVSGGVAQPSVALPMWVMAALALNSLDFQAKLWQPSSWLSWYLPVPVLAGVGLAYFLLVFYPVTSCAAALAEARRHYGENEGIPGWHNRVEQQWLEQLEKEKSSQKKLQALQEAHAYLKNYILTPLKAATTYDPGDATPWVELTHWYGEESKLYRNGRESGREAISASKKAQQLDPEGKEGYLAEHRLRLELAQRPNANAREQYGHAAKSMEAVVSRDPTDARLHYELAATLIRADDPVNARGHAEIARRLDARATTPEPSRLTGLQREQIQKWLSRSPGN